MSSRFLILTGNFSPEPTGIGKYSGEMAHWLLQNGHDCAVVTTYPYYPFWKVQAPFNGRSGWYSSQRTTEASATMRVYRCPHYIPRKPTGGRRILSDLSFFISAFFRVFLLLFQRKYDYVIAVAPPFQLGFLGLMYKWIRGGRLVYHIQDLQIDAAKELGMIRSLTLVKMMFRMERFILKRANFVSTISQGMIRKIVSKGRREVLLFPNWANIETCFPLDDKRPIKESYGFDPDKKVILYSGAIGEKQGLESILELAGSHPQFQYVICGSGPYKEKLMALNDEKQLTNVAFLPLQPMDKFNDFLNMADVHLVLQKKNANDLVMPSKLTSILAVGGLALVTTPPESSLHEDITRFRMGILALPEDTIALEEALDNALADSHEEIRSNARRFSENYLRVDMVLNRFLRDIGGLSGHPVNLQ